MNVSELAKSMNVTESDVLTLAQSVVNSLVQDKAQQEFINASEEQGMEITEAYLIHANKKMQQFTTKYNTNPEAREIFIENIFYLLKSPV